MSDAAAAPTPGAPREAAGDGEPRSARELVLDALLDADGPMTPDMAMAAKGITSRDSVHQALHRLVEAGDAIRVETGLYVKAPPGAKRPRRRALMGWRSSSSVRRIARRSSPRRRSPLRCQSQPYRRPTSSCSARCSSLAMGA